MAILLGNLLDIDLLREMIEQKYIRAQVHPVLPLTIYNYTEHAQYDRTWNDATRMCRGLIVRHLDNPEAPPEAQMEVIARSFSKFFNHGEPDAPALDLDAPAHVSDKMDGSLGIIYPLGNGTPTFNHRRLSVATRGSFMSEQAQRATRLLAEKYPNYWPQDGITTLVEIVYPQNRIVLDYEDAEDLYLLGGVDIATGTIFSPDLMPNWPGPVTEVMSARTLREALLIPLRPNREGIVVRVGYDMVKVKQADYVALHRILTTTSARNIWEHLAVNAVSHLVTEPKQWAKLLGIGPDRAAQVAAAGSDWMDKMLHKVPDEFFDWFRTTIGTLKAKVGTLEAEVTLRFDDLSREYPQDRKGFALAVKDHPHAGILFAMLDGRDITPNLWKAVYPEAERPWGMRSEDISLQSYEAGPACAGPGRAGRCEVWLGWAWHD